MLPLVSDEGFRRLEGPGVMKALAHPLRQRILQQLHLHGPATSTTLAGVLGQNTGTLSYHLRQLERGGLIEDMPHHGDGRERWWRRVGNLDVRQPARTGLAPDEAAVLDDVEGLLFAEDMGHAERFLRGRGEFGVWAQGSRSTLHLTQPQLQEFHDAYLELLQRFAGSDEPEPDSRPILLRWFALPVEEPPD